MSRLAAKRQRRRDKDLAREKKPMSSNDVNRGVGVVQGVLDTIKQEGKKLEDRAVEVKQKVVNVFNKSHNSFDAIEKAADEFENYLNQGSNFEPQMIDDGKTIEGRLDAGAGTKAE